MRFYRIISQSITNLSKQFPAIILTGARQTGKTTLLRSLFKEYKYVSLDLPSEAENAENDPESFLKRHTPPVLIDEAQYAPKLFRHLKIAIEKQRDLAGQFILTGSQKFNLMKNVTDSLAGRCAWLELEDLSIQEILNDPEYKHNKNISDINFIFELMLRGFKPELWDRPNIDFNEYYRSYIATYLERDIRQILNITSLRDFERFLRICAARNAQLINKSEIAKDVGVSLNTVNQWITILEASNQITIVEPYFQNLGKRIVKTPKLYFNEIGILSFLLNLDHTSIEKSPFIGQLWETLVFTELNKQIKNKITPGKLWFYRDNQGNEIDFIIEHSNRLDFFEAKWTQTPDDKSVSNFLKCYNLFKNGKIKHLNIGTASIICRPQSPYQKNEILIRNLHPLDM